MDSLLLLCRVDAFLVHRSSMFVHSVRGFVRDCANCNCVGSAKSLHSVDWENIVRRFEAASKVSPRPFGQSGWLPEFFARTTEPD
ncbi:unnamed protein product [Heligmosomoides polygyrus]|uniref:Secreted protein n=1 Tax=Heligmosomoides polygyrus TaxID=6339 RepID=A0A183GEU6_HELPZ|nr:unnamed protein product [Heligmosomoides polygyrus]